MHCSSRCPGFDYGYRQLLWNVVLEKDEDDLDRSCENEEAIKRVRVENKFILKIERKMDNWIGHILRRNGLLKHVTE
jgi:hypothetical protein